MTWPANGVFAPPQGPPGASGVPQLPQGQQVLPPQQTQGVSYSPDHLPPPPGQQGAYGATPPQPAYGTQPGVPGTQIAQPWNTAAPQQQWGAPQQAQQWSQQQQQAPVPPTFQQQPPQQQTAQQPQPHSVELNDNAILDGPAVPAELRGRTWGDARRLYSALSNDWLQRNRTTTPAAQTLQSQAPQQQAPAQQHSAPQGSAPFWQNPDQRIAEVVGQVVDQRLGPVLQRNQQQGILEARQIAATGIPDFGYLEPDIMQIVAGASPDDLQNPQFWLAASRMARGQRVEQGQYQFNPQQQQPPAAPGRAPGGPGYSQPYGQQPAYAPPPVHSFFSESPSAPNIPSAYGANGGAKTPSQDDYFYAQRWQMPIQDFMAWKYGAGQGVGGSF